MARKIMYFDTETLEYTAVSYNQAASILCIITAGIGLIVSIVLMTCSKLYVKTSAITGENYTTSSSDASSVLISSSTQFKEN